MLIPSVCLSVRPSVCTVQCTTTTYYQADLQCKEHERLKAVVFGRNLNN